MILPKSCVLPLLLVFLLHCLFTVLFFAVALLKSISPNWFFALSNTPSAGLFPEPILLLFVGPSVAGIIGLVVGAASLNPLSPLPGIACPFLGSWFLFTFSSSVISDLILFRMLRLLESCLASASTFACVFVSSFKSSFALLTKILVSSMNDFVLLLSVNWLNRLSALATKSSNDAVLIATFSVTTFGVSTSLACLSAADSFTEVLFCPSGSLAVADACPVTSWEGSEDLSVRFWGFWTFVGSELVSCSAAWTLPPLRKNNPVATATLAAPKLTLRIL